MILIDKKKLRTAIRVVSCNRKNPVQFKEPPPLFIDGKLNPEHSAYWAARRGHEKANSAERATALCSLMAHSRGKLHVQKEWVPTYLSDGSQKLVTRTMEDQEKLIAAVAKEFEAPAGYVVYEVRGSPGPKMAGPYTAAEIDAQFDDIKGFEGVFNARITTSVPPMLRPSEPVAGAPTDAPAPVAPSAA